MSTHAIHTRTNNRLREVIGAGASAGMIGGVAMLAVAFLYSFIVGIDPWASVAAITATVRNSPVIEITFGTVLVGTAIHLSVAAVWGVVFACAIPRNVMPAPALAFGTFAGVCILVMMTWGILPIISPTVRDHFLWGSTPRNHPVVIAFAMHLTFGACLALVPWLERRTRA